MLNNIEGEIIEPAKRPDSNAQQNDNLEFRVINHEKPGSAQSENEEQEALDLDPAGIGDVFHIWCLLVSSGEQEDLAGWDGPRPSIWLVYANRAVHVISRVGVRHQAVVQGAGCVAENKNAATGLRGVIVIAHQQNTVAVADGGGTAPLKDIVDPFRFLGPA